MWDAEEKARMQFEAKILAEYHPGCEIVQGNDFAVVRLWHCVNNAWYRLRVYVPTAYPDEKPRAYVEYPVPLLQHSGRAVAEIGPSHNFHTLTATSDGEVQLCHFSDRTWDATKTVHLVVLKAKMWLQAYGEHHLLTGKPICDFFTDCV